MASALGNIGALAHAVNVINAPPPNPNGGSQGGTQNAPAQGTVNRNLSRYQFSQARAIGTIGNATNAALSGSSAVPNIGDVSYNTPNSIPSGLYT